MTRIRHSTCLALLAHMSKGFMLSILMFPIGCFPTEQPPAQEISHAPQLPGNGTTAPPGNVEPAVANGASAAAVKAADDEDSDRVAAALTPHGILAVEDWFAWHKFRASYRAAGGAANPNLAAAFTAAAKDLRAETPPQKINDALALLALDWKLIGADPGEGQPAEFAVSFLFHKSGPLELPADHKVVLILRGTPDPARQKYLSESPDGYFELYFDLEQPLQDWPQNEYRLIKRAAYKPLPSLPYQMLVYFSLQRLGEDGSWQYVDRYGEFAHMGWHVDLGTPAP